MSTMSSDGDRKRKAGSVSEDDETDTSTSRLTKQLKAPPSPPPEDEAHANPRSLLKTDEALGDAERDAFFKRAFADLDRDMEKPSIKKAMGPSNLTIDDVESGKVTFGGGMRSYRNVDGLPKWHWEENGTGRYPCTSDVMLRNDPNYYQVMKDAVELGYDIAGVYDGPDKTRKYRDAVRMVIRSKDFSKVEIVDFLLTYGCRKSLAGEEPLALAAVKQFMSGELNINLLVTLMRNNVDFDEQNDEGTTANKILSEKVRREVEHELDSDGLYIEL